MMLSDYIRNVPLTKRHTAKVYVFRVSLEPSEFGGWIATHPLLVAHNERVSGDTKYEAFCSAQVLLSYIVKDHEASVAAHNPLSRVIVTDQTDATIVGRHTSAIDRACVLLGHEANKRFVEELVSRYSKNNPARFAKHQKAIAVMEAVRDVYAPSRGEVIDRFNPQFIDQIAKYLFCVWDNDDPGDSEEMAQDFTLSFIWIVSAAICDGMVRREADGRVFLNKFEIPLWFVKKIESEWRRTRKMNKYVSFDYQDDRDSDV